MNSSIPLDIPSNICLPNVVKVATIPPPAEAAISESSPKILFNNDVKAPDKESPKPTESNKLPNVPPMSENKTPKDSKMPVTKAPPLEPSPKAPSNASLRVFQTSVAVVIICCIIPGLFCSPGTNISANTFWTSTMLAFKMPNIPKIKAFIKLPAPFRIFVNPPPLAEKNLENIFCIP